MASAVSAPDLLCRLERARDTSVNAERSQGSAFAETLSSVRARPGVSVVAPVRTQLDSGQASSALRAAWQAVTGEQPSEGTVRVLTAQWAHETGNGASMFNYNFGGIKGSGPTGLTVAQRTREGFGATERTLVDRFRAYRTAEEGATDYVRLLHDRFPVAASSAKSGDAVGFVHALKARGYFTGDEAAYTRSVVALAGMRLPDAAAATPPTLDLAPRVLASNDLPSSLSAPSSLVIDGLAMSDEISRAALRIAAATKPERESG